MRSTRICAIGKTRYDDAAQADPSFLCPAVEGGTLRDLGQTERAGSRSGNSQYRPSRRRTGRGRWTRPRGRLVATDFHQRQAKEGSHSMTAERTTAAMRHGPDSRRALDAYTLEADDVVVGKDVLELVSNA